MYCNVAGIEEVLKQCFRRVNVNVEDYGFKPEMGSKFTSCLIAGFHILARKKGRNDNDYLKNSAYETVFYSSVLLKELKDISIPREKKTELLRRFIKIFSYLVIKDIFLSSSTKQPMRTIENICREYVKNELQTKEGIEIHRFLFEKSQ